MSRLKADELAKEISNFVNGAGINEFKELVELMAKDHPTLQQSKMKLACLFIEEMAIKEYTDARNEQSKKTALAMIKGYKMSERKNTFVKMVLYQIVFQLILKRVLFHLVV